MRVQRVLVALLMLVVVSACVGGGEADSAPELADDGEHSGWLDMSDWSTTTSTSTTAAVAEGRSDRDRAAVTAALTKFVNLANQWAANGSNDVLRRQTVADVLLADVQEIGEVAEDYDDPALSVRVLDGAVAFLKKVVDDSDPCILRGVCDGRGVRLLVETVIEDLAQDSEIPLADAWIVQLRG